MSAMMNGLGSAMPPPPQRGAMVAGPDGLPVGGSPPPPGSSTGDSPLLAALLGGPPSESGDPYTQPPGVAQFGGMGTGDPKMGLGRILEMLALAQSGSGSPGQGGPLGGMFG